MGYVPSIAGIMLLVGLGVAVAQPTMTGQPGTRIPAVAPFDHPGMPRAMLSAPPMLLDVAELQNMLSDLGIAKPTMEKIVSITRNFLTSLDGRLIKVQREDLNIKEELLKDKPDLKVIQDCVARKSQIFSEIEFSQIKRDLEIKSLLSRDEYDKWKSAMMKKMSQMLPLGKDRPGPEARKAEPR